MPKVYYTADQCHTGGHECNHKHQTATTARKCLPRLPRTPSGSLTQPFSMATIHRYEDGHEVDLREDDYAD